VAKFSVIYDACVLYPAPVRDLLMQLALTDLFKARWTDQIHEEWIEAIHPDEFVYSQIDLAPAIACSAIKRQRESLKNPPKAKDEFLAILQKQQLPQTVSALRAYIELI